MPIPRKPIVPLRPELPDGLRGERAVCPYCLGVYVWIGCTACGGDGGHEYECPICFGYTGRYTCRCYPEHVAARTPGVPSWSPGSPG